MEEEKLLLTQRDRDRLKVLHEVRQGHLTERQASAQLKLSDRGIRKLLLRMKERRDRAMVHGLQGRSSARRISDKVEERAVEPAVPWAGRPVQTSSSTRSGAVK